MRSSVGGVSRRRWIFAFWTGCTYDRGTDSHGLLTITKHQYSKLKNLDFKIGSNTYSLSPNAQIWPRSLKINIGGNSDRIYLAVADLEQESGQCMES
ncbi:hypothetical protein PLICRDRAFT_43462 [Plicaturopsis crispa FD-325 SS-3]|nr:hypothetical protein PLICRDRAFT_43462 [Plicaturopsis crispa FD-325 SS-3]